MSKCREAFFQHHGAWPEAFTTQTWLDWQAAWNARGNVDAGIARDFHANIIRDDCVLVLANTIEMKNER